LRHDPGEPLFTAEQTLAIISQFRDMEKAASYADDAARFEAECQAFCRASHEARWPSAAKPRWYNPNSKPEKGVVAEWQRLQAESRKDYLSNRR